MNHESVYISSNCNQTPTALHWGSNGLICYATCNAVLIYDPKWGSGGKVLYTLVGHSKRVNSVRWLSQNELVSGSSDHTAIVWKQSSDSYSPIILKGHTSNVNLVDGLCQSKKTIVVTAGMDSRVLIWIKTKSDYLLTKEICYGYSICLSLRIAIFYETVILACASDNSKVDLYLEHNDFTKVATLIGHEDWIRGLDFTTDKNDLLLASSSQDCFIRIWRITSENLPAKIANVIQAKSQTYKVYIDSILTGHDGWIYSVYWHPCCLQLLSSSLDKSMILWELDETNDLWLEKMRVGEIGGNSLGFYGGVFSPTGDQIIGHSYNGSFHLWTKKENSWQACVTVGGHFREAVDLAWEAQGRFLISISADQTTRIHAPWQKKVAFRTWHEIARPQIHGYDLTSIAILSTAKFASSAEEKIIRMFEAPDNFFKSFSKICGIDLCHSSHIKGAAVPSLGLSNKAVFSNEVSDFTEVITDVPPTEETLLQNTLWPEVQKLYGHGYEVWSLAASPDGTYLASACKAKTQEHASILIWKSDLWNLSQTLKAHNLTVVQMSFSPNSKYLLSVSRDRTWNMFQKNLDGFFEFLATCNKETRIHTRIIWCCAWSNDCRHFVTGSRDGKVAVWSSQSGKSASEHLEIRNEAVTAIAVAPIMIQNSYFIGVGFQSGSIFCYNWSSVGWELSVVLNQSLAHHLTVTRLLFRPICENDNLMELASCGNDYIVKIHGFKIK